MVCVADLNLHHLRSLLTLAEELHFGRAAERLYLTQPALSQQISSLEGRLGVQLFARTSRRVEITPAGRTLLPLARRVLAASDDLRHAADRPTADTHTLRLGLTDCAAALASTRTVVTALATLRPGLELDLQVVDIVELTTALSTGDLDAAFAFLPTPDLFEAQPLTTEPRVATISAMDPLASRSSVRLAELADRPVVSLAPEVSEAERRFWAVDPRPDAAPVTYTDHHVARVESLLCAVSFDRAVAFLPAVAADLYPRPDVRYLPVDDLAPCTYAVIWPTASASATIEALKDTCRHLHNKGLPSGTWPDLPGGRRPPARRPPERRHRAGSVSPG